MNNFWTRAFTGAVFVAVMIAAIEFSPYTFMILFMVINLLSIIEFYKLFIRNELTPRIFSGIVLSAILYATSALVASGTASAQLLFINIPMLFLIFIFELYLKSEKPFENIAYTLLGVAYLTLPLALFNSMAFLPGENTGYHSGIIIGYFLILWASDTGAYLSGMKFGKHKLFERHSPKKTWEGSIGGCLAALLLGYTNSLFFTQLALSEWLIVGLLIVITGTFGDLIESMLKRSLKIKDSGNILPGHGGMLDRFDGLFISIPFVFTYLALIGKV
ncbi:MAG TPA: phosphatidate cytidylyltransferase [Bacteroidia bacterium]|nr:phosphatidate cytidylyltransferase [Bacteroidia bacterium]HQW17145.1 phosphatidate cytidylyltransferase [Bacteroidia bacterium]HQW49998.1 phosphatidate cytidylyltransferase [Bacteroidia bacterium]HQX70156.1 phosphatidate cytidylyltransferase [Bacteroidia bacterium]HQZ76469.1 phosphatidate cytidylyltransferase [Bacteroidia bacterium]